MSGKNDGRKSSSGKHRSSRRSKRDIHKEFELLVDNLAIKGDKRKQMLSMSEAQKKEMLKGYAHMQLAPISTENPPAYYVEQLRKDISVKDMASLRTLLCSKPVDWLRAFIDADGLSPLIALLAGCNDKKTKSSDDLKVISYCVASIRGLMNAHLGAITAVASVHGSLLTLIKSLENTDKKHQRKIWDVLAGVTVLSPETHRIAVHSLQQTFTSHLHKCELNGLGVIRKFLQDGDSGARPVVLILVNHLINRVESLVQRYQLRRELGLVDANELSTLYSQLEMASGSDALVMQLHIFEESFHDDQDALGDEEGMGNLTVELVKEICEELRGLPGLQWISEVLRHSRLLEKEGQQATDSWQLVDLFVQQTASADYSNIPVEFAKAVVERLHKTLNIEVTTAAGSQELDEAKAAVAKLKHKLETRTVPKQKYEKEKADATTAKQEAERAKTELASKNTELQALHKQLSEIEAAHKLALEQAQKAASKDDPVVVPAASSGSSEGASDAEQAAVKEQLQKTLTELTQAQETIKTFESKIQSLEAQLAAAPAAGGEGGPPPPPPPGDIPPPPPPPGDIPPPPPPPPGGIPPPPPPPPGGVPPPPPPPGGGPPPPPGAGPPPPAGRPKKPQPKPALKMKVFNWTKLPDTKIDKTLWDNTITDNGVRLNTNELEQLFGIVVAPATEEGHAESSAGPSSSKPKALQLLDSGRANNINILMNKFSKVPLDEVRRAILEFNEDFLTTDTLKILIKLKPSPEEMALISENADDPNLGTAEKFLHMLGGIQHLGVRLDSALLRDSFERRLTEIKESVEVIAKSVSEIKGSTKFVSVLKLVLAIGNYINGGTARGGAYGFKLSSLSKLVDVRSSNRGETLIHYLATLCDKSYPELKSLAEDFPHLAPAMRENLADVLSAAKTLHTEVTSMTEKIGSLPASHFKSVISNFCTGAAGDAQQTLALCERTRDVLKELLVGYGELPDANSAEFLGYIHEFVTSFHKAFAENVQRIQAAAKAEEMAKKRAEAAAKAGSSRPAGEEGEGDGALDNLLAQAAVGGAARLRPAGGPPRGGFGNIAMQAVDLRGALRKATPAPGPKGPAPEGNTGVIDFKAGLKKRNPDELSPRAPASDGAAPAIDFKAGLKKRNPPETNAPKPAAAPQVDFRAALKKRDPAE